jgi:hypothetical protein
MVPVLISTFSNSSQVSIVGYNFWFKANLEEFLNKH